MGRMMGRSKMEERMNMRGRAGDGETQSPLVCLVCLSVPEADIPPVSIFPSTATSTLVSPTIIWTIETA